MIFIISANGDTSTDNVIAYLKAKKEQYCRINFDDFFDKHINISVNLDNDRRELVIGNKCYNQKDIERSVVWCRKIASMGSLKHSFQLKQSLGDIYNHINKEYDAFISSVMFVLNDAYWICHHNAQYLHKVNALICAQKCGLLIPRSTITNNKKCLIRYHAHPIITKCLGDGLNIMFNNTMYLLSTTKLDEKQMKLLPNYFMPSMTQSYVDKYVELRVFFIEGDFFATAIFSQESQNTKIDFRIITENERHCRMTPFQLPNQIKKKLNDLMTMLNLNTGSIDMIYTNNDQYYFLEVNPAGQYGWVANSCNYNIDNCIANHLKRISNEREFM